MEIRERKLIKKGGFMDNLDQKIQELADIEKKIEALSVLKDGLRKEVFEVIETNKLDQYKTDKATISYIERKTVKVLDEAKLLEQFKEQRTVKYFDVVPAHEELNANFQKDVKEGVFTSDLVEVAVNKTLAIRFNK